MNIFWVTYDHNEVSNAQMQTDRHLKLAIPEMFQHICSALRFLGFEHEDILEESDIYSPWSIWTRTNAENLLKMWRICAAYCREHNTRFGELPPMYNKLFSIANICEKGYPDRMGLIEVLQIKYSNKLGEEHTSIKETPYPVDIPNKFIIKPDELKNGEAYKEEFLASLSIESYRNYLSRKYSNPIFTKRDIPLFYNEIRGNY